LWLEKNNSPQSPGAPPGDSRVVCTSAALRSPAVILPGLGISQQRIERGEDDGAVGGGQTGDGLAAGEHGLVLQKLKNSGQSSLKATQDSHLLEELPISPAPNRQHPAEYQWGAVLAGALR